MTYSISNSASAKGTIKEYLNVNLWNILAVYIRELYWFSGRDINGTVILPFYVLFRCDYCYICRSFYSVSQIELYYSNISFALSK